MRNILFAVLVLLSFNALAKGSSKDTSDDMILPRQLPCFVKISERAYVNAYAITAILKASNDEYVYVYTGKDYNTVNVGNGKQEAYIQSIFNVINSTCK